MKNQIFNKKYYPKERPTVFDLIISLPNKKKQKISKIKIPLLGVHNVRILLQQQQLALRLEYR